MTEPEKDGRVPALVLGASGYVAGELLRLLSAHPKLRLEGAQSESSAGKPLQEVFPQLQSSFDGHRFCSREELKAIVARASGKLAVFSAASHGASAALVKDVLDTKTAADVKVVDLSADFRFPDAPSYEAVYGKPHGAPGLLSEFACALPEHTSLKPNHAGQPGCFATAMLLAIVPLLKLGITEPDVFASGVTGSTGAGREPRETTHHPLRHSNLFAYNALQHRHGPEVSSITERVSGVRPNLHFVPHSGPFSRGIYMTVQAKLLAPLNDHAIRSELARFYEGAPFVKVVPGAPKVKDIVASNFAHLGVASNGKTVAVFSVVDNLTKGAAGGGVQWMNRLLDWPETTGLTLSGPGWI